MPVPRPTPIYFSNPLAFAGFLIVSPAPLAVKYLSTSPKLPPKPNIVLAAELPPIRGFTVKSLFPAYTIRCPLPYIVRASEVKSTPPPLVVVINSAPKAPATPKGNVFPESLKAA